MIVERTCERCGYRGRYATARLAEAHFTRHSCAKQRRRAAAARRRAEMEANAVRRDCQHPGHRHGHGTRVAYVKDRCRCRPCRDANAEAVLAASRAEVFGRWSPYQDASHVREHIAALRDAGVGVGQIAKLAGTSRSHIRALVDAHDPIARVRARTAERILAINPRDVTNHAAHSRIDATGTRRRLQALVTIGYPLAELASRLGRTTGNLGRCLASDSVNAHTFLDVADLYDALSNTVPHFGTDAERDASHRARAFAQERGWLPPLAWDDIDHDAEPEASDWTRGEDIDEIAVERALAGDGIRLEHLNWAEQAEVVRLLTERGKSIRDIADLLATTARTVSRRRRRVRAA